MQIGLNHPFRIEVFEIVWLLVEVDHRSESARSLRNIPFFDFVGKYT